MKVVAQLTCLTLGRPNGPAYSTGELLNTPQRDRLKSSTLQSAAAAVVVMDRTAIISNNFRWHLVALTTHQHVMLQAQLSI